MFKTSRRTVAATLVRAALLAAVVAAPVAATHAVRAESSTAIGTTPTMSNGIGLVLLVSLRRG